MCLPFRVDSGLLVLLLFGLCSMASAQQPPVAKPERAMAYVGPPPARALPVLYTTLLRLRVVQKELNLTDEQRSELDDVTRKVQTTIKQSGVELRKLSPDERKAKNLEVAKQIEAQSDEAKKAIEKVLLPKQLQRLKGIALQMAGISAIRDKEIQQDLKLSNDQVGRIMSINDILVKQVDELHRQGGDPRSFGPRMRQLTAVHETQVLQVLTGDQRRAFETMKGSKVDLPRAY